MTLYDQMEALTGASGSFGSGRQQQTYNEHYNAMRQNTLQYRDASMQQNMAQQQNAHHVALAQYNNFFPQPVKQTVEEFVNSFYAPSGDFKPKTRTDRIKQRIARAYYEVAVSFGKWLIRISE